METYISIMESADLKLNVDFLIYDTNSWPNWFYVCFVAIIFLGLQILAWIVPTLFGKWSLIAFKKEHHLDEFEPDDRRNIFINKCLTALFVFNVLQVMKYLQEVDKFATGIENITLVNFFGAICCFYIFYDFWYTNFHRFLHLGFIYPYIHKHHHRQKAPSRGNLDAINVHPFEFFVGEYLHLFSVYMIHRYVFKTHVLSVVVFILLGGILASLNHTRFNVVIKAFMNIYAVSAHDVHHTDFKYNYGQYTMMWDWIFGTYRHYDVIHPPVSTSGRVEEVKQKQKLTEDDKTPLTRAKKVPKSAKSKDI